MFKISYDIILSNIILVIFNNNKIRHIFVVHKGHWNEWHILTNNDCI